MLNVFEGGKLALSSSVMKSVAYNGVLYAQLQCISILSMMGLATYLLITLRDEDACSALPLDLCLRSVEHC